MDQNLSFIDKLRANSLFTHDNPNPLQPPDFGDTNPTRGVVPIRGNYSGYGPPVRPTMMQNIGTSMIHGPNMVDGKPVTNIPGDMGYNVQYQPTGIPEQFVNNILNPPERGFKFQDMLNKRDLALRGLDIKSDNADTAAMRAQTGRYSAETRRNLADLHDLTDSEKLEMLQSGRTTLQELKDAAEMARVKQRGTNATDLQGAKNKGTMDAIGARGDQTRRTNAAKGTTQSNTQIGVGQRNRATELRNTDPSLGQYISLDDKGNVVIDPNTPPDSLELIKSKVYGQGGDISLPSDKGSLSGGTGIQKQSAIDALTSHGLPLTEENIKKAMDPSNWIKK